MAESTAPTKKPWLSKTVCLNVVAGVAAAVAFWNPEAGAWLGTNNELVCTVGLAVANVVLRLVTKAPIALG